MKKNYETPELTIETFEVEDIITTSGDPDPVGGGNDNLPSA